MRTASSSSAASSGRHRHRPLPVVLAAVVALCAVAQAPATTLAADHNDPIGVQANYVAGSGDNGGYQVDTNDPAADIADIFAWYTGDPKAPKSVVLALTWRVDPLEDREKSFDPTVEYGIHIDTSDKKLVDVKLSGDGLTLGSKLHTQATNDIIVWFGPHKDNKKLVAKGQPAKWGLLATGIPGVKGEIVGPVGSVIERDGVKVAAGLFDDAFFADLDGFFNSISVALGNAPASNPSLPPQAVSQNGRFDPRDRWGTAPKEKSGILRPFGYPVKQIDGFGKQNVHALVVEVPADRFASKKLHVWGTTQRVHRLNAKSGRRIGCSFDYGSEEYHCKDESPGTGVSQ